VKAFTVYYDAEAGEMTRLDFAPGFQHEGVLVRADVLKDARNAIAAAYDEAKAALLSELQSGKAMCSTDDLRYGI